MNSGTWIAFDADDTLWHNENIFEGVHGRYFQLLELGRSMLNHPVELLEGARETLDKLLLEYPLLLITKGDLRDQERKLAKSGIADRFRAIEIVSEKDSRTYERIFRRHSIRPSRFLMVGNSLKSDILPVLELGGSGVHVPYRITWGHEDAEAPEVRDNRFFEAKSLFDLPEIVRRWRGPLLG